MPGSLWTAARRSTPLHPWTRCRPPQRDLAVDDPLLYAAAKAIGPKQLTEEEQDRIAKQMGINQASIHNHLLKMATLPNLINADWVRGFTVAQVAEKHGWPEPLVTGSKHLAGDLGPGTSGNSMIVTTGSGMTGPAGYPPGNRALHMGDRFGSGAVLACERKGKTRPGHF